MGLASNARMQGPSFSSNQTRVRPQSEQKGLQAQQDANIPGARRSSPFTRGRQQTNKDDGARTADGEPASSASGKNVFNCYYVTSKYHIIDIIGLFFL